MNPIVKLSEMCQRKWGANIETRVIGKTGPDHNPTVFIEIKLPDGSVYKADGSNQKIAKQKAAELALANM